MADDGRRTTKEELKRVDFVLVIGVSILGVAITYLMLANGVGVRPAPMTDMLARTLVYACADIPECVAEPIQKFPEILSGIGMGWAIMAFLVAISLAWIVEIWEEAKADAKR